MCDALAMLRGRGVRIFAESVGIALCEDLHHPAIKIVDRVIHDGFESPIVFSVSFLNVIPQPDADILVLTAKTNLLRSQHLNILHRNFGNAIRAAVKLLFVGRQTVDIKSAGAFWLACGGRRGLEFGGLDHGGFFARDTLAAGGWRRRLMNRGGRVVLLDNPGRGRRRLRRRAAREAAQRLESPRWEVARRVRLALVRDRTRVPGRRWCGGLGRHRRWSRFLGGQRRCDARNLGLEGRPWAGLQRNGYESRQDFQRPGERCGRKSAPAASAESALASLLLPQAATTSATA